MLLGSARGEDDGPPVGKRAGGGFQIGDRHPRDPFHAGGPVCGGACPDLRPARGPLVQIGLVSQALGDDQMQQPEGQRKIGAGRGLQVERGGSRGHGGARVHDDLHARRCSLCSVRYRA